MKTIHEDPQELIDAFHLMYDNFPEAAQLTHKSRRIVAINPAGEGMGRHPGMTCIKHGPIENHKGCIAAKAINEQKPCWTIHESPGGGNKFAVVWLPVPGHPDYYIHFSAGNLSYYLKTQEE